MKRRIIILSILFMISGISAHAHGRETEESCTFEGKILDRSNAEALTGATIQIEELGLTTYAGFDGSFSFSDVPAGNYTVKVSFVSYQDVVYDEVKVSTAHGSRNFLLRSP
jgi:hypothetical protein